MLVVDSQHQVHKQITLPTVLDSPHATLLGIAEAVREGCEIVVAAGGDCVANDLLRGTRVVDVRSIDEVDSMVEGGPQGGDGFRLLGEVAAGVVGELVVGDDGAG